MDSLPQNPQSVTHRHLTPTQRGVLVFGVVAIAVLLVSYVYATYLAKLNYDKVVEEARKASQKTEQSQGQVPSDWQTYRNEEYGFEFRYPGEFFSNITEENKSFQDAQGVEFIQFVEFGGDFNNIFVSLYKSPLDPNESIDGYRLGSLDAKKIGDRDAFGYSYGDGGCSQYKVKGSYNSLQSIQVTFLSCSGADWTENDILVTSDKELINQILSTFRFIKLGYIEGSLGYPSLGIPSNMEVCAENLATKEIYCTQGHILDSKYQYGEGYKLKLLEGDYYVFARLNPPRVGIPEYWAYYSEFVTCGLRVECKSHEPILVKVVEGKTNSGIDPQDWYKE